MLSSVLERINGKLQDIESAGHMGSSDGKVVSELVDEIRAAITNCQVSNKARTVSGI